MAYSDYGAFVYRNGVRMPNKEDVPPLGDADVEAVGSGARIWVHLLKLKAEGKDKGIADLTMHGVYGDGAFLLCMRKTYPYLLRVTEAGLEQLDSESFLVEGDQGWWRGEIDGHTFEVVYDEDDVRARVNMKTPDGTEWTGYSGYQCGAGHEDDEL